jgi:hypothetical protein
MTANLEEAGTWYYVVDCATCKALIPFKHAPEDEPVVRFPTMRVRCFQCHTDHTYAADLISHRKAVAPPGIFNADQQPLTRVMVIEKQFGIDKKMAASGTREDA